MPPDPKRDGVRLYDTINKTRKFLMLIEQDETQRSIVRERCRMLLESFLTVEELDRLSAGVHPDGGKNPLIRL